jgi:hypothetical protein
VGRFERCTVVALGSVFVAACGLEDAAQAALDVLPDDGSWLDAGPHDAGLSDAGLVDLPDAGGSITARDTSTDLSPDAACGANIVAAKQVLTEVEVVVEETIEETQPVALYIVLDQSLSMDWENLWSPAKNAIKSFVSDPSSAGIDVALEFFPEGGGQCNGSGYDTPAVAMGRLPDHAQDITGELDKRGSAGGIGTPIEGALRGATQYCQRFQQSSADGEKCVAVLITDGDPLGCEGSTSKLAAIAEAAYASGSGVRTFAVGLKGADFTLLDAIARAGGAVDCAANSTRFACDVSSGPEQLSNALAQIRSVVTTVRTRVQTTTELKEMPLECEWALPTPNAGETFDKDRVNVQLSAPSLATPVDFGRVADQGVCAARGWYYDDPEAPTRLVACPETCELLRATTQAEVQVLLGCATVPLL